MRPSAPDPVVHLSELPHSAAHSPLILTGPGTSPASAPSTMTRAAYARLSSAGFPTITDRRGNPPQVIDPREELRLHLDTEAVDQLLSNEIVIQFLALSRVYLKDIDGQSVGIPCVLQKFNKDGFPSDESPGLTPGEGRVFSQYLLSQSLHIDVWDGDSLLLIGSTGFKLKNLLRQGREAVVVAHELDVVSTEFSEEAAMQSGDMTRTGTARPFGIKSAVEAKLHVRVANIGHTSEGPKGKLGTVPKKLSTVVISETVTETGAANTPTGNKSTKIKAKQMAECDAELSAVLFSRQEKITKDDQPVREADAIRKRKLERMQAVRQTQGADTSTGNLIIQKEEKLQRTRDLKTIQLYREKLRHEKILASLAGNITTSHTIYPSFGRAEFFEFVLRNPYSTDQTVTIHCDDNELKVITDTREWRHFKRKTETRSGDCGSFLSFDHGPSHPLKQQAQTYLKTSISEENSLKPRQIKVSFRNKEERPIAILTLQVEPRPHVIDRTFRFYHAEQSFLKKTIRLPPWRSLPGAPVMDDNTQPQVHVRCSDVNTVCEARKMPSGEPQDVFFKIACGPSPSVKRLFVLLFIIDMTALLGQSSRLSVILRGTQSSRLVQCFSSHPEELQRVSFTNPYPTKKTFHLKTNRPDMLQFKESIIEVGTGESHSIGLRFTPQQFPGKSEILIFINDSEDKNEETFSINAVYTLAAKKAFETEHIVVFLLYQLLSHRLHKKRLFYYEMPPEASSLLLIEACTLNFVLQIHRPMKKVFHLIPENAIMSGADFVPGILESQPEGSGIVDILKNPRLAKTTPSFSHFLISAQENTSIKLMIYSSSRMQEMHYKRPKF
ncbi:Nephrocystin-4 [Stylophora pistillata]|uniref:Nephrocystin-4 n=1 Tax=Stylophora pistillata TaxID=50429 RepID=A0A2B4SLD4_STYPI|nr:Nephrocystin-4 [Stylophora pistillata]